MRVVGSALALVASLAACDDMSEPTPPSPAPSAANAAKSTEAPAARAFITLRERTDASGITFVHHNGAQGRHVMIEAMGGGVAVIDYDGDGKQDLYFVDSGEVPVRTEAQAPGGNRLYRNLGGWKFEDVTARAGVAGRGYMMGAVVGDYDNDGDQDLYVTSYGSNSLLQNQGDGTFRDVTQSAGCDDARWSTGAAFVDYDRDGKLDLFVQNYLDYSVELHRPHMQGEYPSYPVPDLYEPVACSLFRNRGDGTFANVSSESGIAAARGKGLGVLVADLDGELGSEIYCANDTAPNCLFHLTPQGRFEELGLVSGTGYGADGREEAGMGVDAADLDGDGRLDIVVANFFKEPNSIYRNEGALNFTEVSERSGTATAAMRSLGFGLRLLDLDNDGVQDWVVNNGHVYDNAPLTDPPATWAQAPLLFRGVGRARFVDVLAEQPPEFRRARVGRGLAAADFDDDGDLDLVLTAIASKPALFENVGGEQRSWTCVRCVGTKRDSTALGARVTVEAGGKTQLGDVRSGGSYLSQSDLRLFFGLGEATAIERVSVRWPDGTVEEARDVPVRRQLLFVEGSGLQR